MKKRVNELSNLLEQIELKDNEKKKEKTCQQQKKMHHPMRAIFIALDMTKTIQMKDFKPSRLSVATQMIKHFIKKSKQSTPIIKYSFSVVEQQICKLRSAFTLNVQQIFEIIDVLKVESNGFFSLQNVLRSALQNFEGVSNCFKKQILIIQASSLTKDYRNIYETIELFKQARIKVNIISMVGWTHVFQKLVQKTQGRYFTVESNEQFKKYTQLISLPQQMNEQDIQKTIFKVSLAKKQYNEKGVLCYCHLKQVQNYYICGFCNGVICKSPPIQCSICKKLVIIPSQLSRHQLFETQ